MTFGTPSRRWMTANVAGHEIGRPQRPGREMRFVPAGTDPWRRGTRWAGERSRLIRDVRGWPSASSSRSRSPSDRLAVEPAGDRDTHQDSGPPTQMNGLGFVISCGLAASAAHARAGLGRSPPAGPQSRWKTARPTIVLRAMRSSGSLTCVAVARGSVPRDIEDAAKSPLRSTRVPTKPMKADRFLTTSFYAAAAQILQASYDCKIEHELAV